ncbi:hypothetical protein [Mycolicibacterium arenosum]|uniref:Cullin, a subunit of E3 ubiquitin ligase n=1 Tax=Mycolicibacterium arenosum TaxID=2952157 RepID=A0ABT1LZA1_9MYCO|nr:hypothetical protein [Mycolicibacterium sp. CAU 1645]MCP9271925.1 hypothetical protein [Mycolicibacterium sp. CAU 1645]
MDMPFIGAEAIRDGILTRARLRWNYESLHPGVYLAKGAEQTILVDAVAAWLRTGRRGVVAGRAASALHGANWVDAGTPIEIIADHTRPREGVIVREERLAADEIMQIGGLPVTSIPRTALDLARHLPRDEAVAALDALAAATGVTINEVLPLLARYRGARGIRAARVALDLMDGGAQSPRETSLRLLLIDAGYPRPRSQIRVTDGATSVFLDMGYDEIKVGLDYEGEHHSEDRDQYVHDIGRSQLVAGQGWLDIKVVKEHSRAYILHRVDSAFQQRGWRPRFASSA